MCTLFSSSLWSNVAPEKLSKILSSLSCPRVYSLLDAEHITFSHTIHLRTEHKVVVVARMLSLEPTHISIQIFSYFELIPEQPAQRVADLAFLPVFCAIFDHGSEIVASEAALRR